MTDYIEIEDLQGDMPTIEWSGRYDTLGANLITQASQLMDELFGITSGGFKVTDDTIRYYNGSGKPFQLIDYIAAAPTEVAVNENGDRSTYTAWTASDYFPAPYNKTPYRKLIVDQINGSKTIFYPYPQAVKITAKFGFSITVPPLIKRATTIQVVRWLIRAQQGYQDVGAIPELSQLKYVAKLDPDIATIKDQFDVGVQAI